MNYIHEALYMTLSGYAKEIIEMNDNSLDGKMINMARAMNKQFNKKTKLYTKQQASRIVSILDQWNETFKNNTTAPTILLIITLDYLLNEIEHTRTRVLFGHYKSLTRDLFNQIDASTYRKTLFKHLDLIDNFIEGVN